MPTKKQEVKPKKVAEAKKTVKTAPAKKQDVKKASATIEEPQKLEVKVVKPDTKEAKKQEKHDIKIAKQEMKTKSESDKVTVKIAAISRSASDYLQTQQAKKVKRIILWSCLAAFILIFFVFAFLAKYIFGPNSEITRIAEENILQIFNIYNFFADNLDTIFRSISAIIIILVIMYALLFIMRLFSRGSNRRKTILSMCGSFIRYICYIVMVCVVLSIWGVQVGAILAGAGVLGIVIGLGAQSLVSDILSGIFIIFENNIQVGDIITFQNFRGEVLELGIRTTKIKNVLGDVNIVNNSEIRNLVNMSKHRSVAVCEITINYGENLERVEALIKAHLPKMAEKFDVITEGPNYIGVSEFTDRGTVLKVTAKCTEENRLQLARDINRELKLLFDKNKIKIAVPQVEIKK